MEHNGASHDAFVIGTTAAWFDIRPRPMAEGRVFKADEEAEAVCVLAQMQREGIFGEGPAIGETLMVRGAPFRVIGVLKEEPPNGLFNDGGWQNMIFLPAKAAQDRIPLLQINRFIAQTNPASPPEQVLDEITRTLLASHGREDFAVLTQRQVLGTLYRLMTIVTAMLSGISAISLVVAGIGIMNIMLVTVTERTFEIGIRRAVGARRRDIFVHFLSEALIISILGGAAGLAVAGGLCVLAERYSPIHPLVTPGVVTMAFGICVALGLLFGTAPALRAARLNPAAALRHE